jgi:hypothetical protein
MVSLLLLFAAAEATVANMDHTEVGMDTDVR